MAATTKTRTAKPSGKRVSKPRRSKTPPAKTPPRKPGRPRKAEPEARKAAILDAALHVFAERGYEAARLDDVAGRAGVAKGTLYLYFKDKETLFEEVVRSAVSPVLEHLTALAATPDLPFDKALDALYAMFETEVLGTQRKLLIRLIIAEGPRFPRIAEFYYRNVIARIMPIIRKLAEQAARDGTLSTGAVVRYPQLVAAPLVMTIIWDALFHRIKPLDVTGFLQAYREVVAPRKRRRAS